MAKKDKSKGGKLKEDNTKEDKPKEDTSKVEKKPMMVTNIFSGKHLLAIAIGLIFLVVLIYFRQGSETSIVTTTTTSSPTTTTTQQTTTTTTVPTATGRLTITMDSEDDSIPGGAKAHRMEFTITGIEIYNDAGDWVVVSEEPTTVDIVNNANDIVVFDGDVEAGNYEKIKLKMSDGEIWITNELMYIYSPKRYDLVAVEQDTVDYEFNLTSEPLTLGLVLDVRNSVVRTGIEYMLDPTITVSEST